MTNFGTPVAEQCCSRHGDVLIILFFLTQALDGVFTYMGIAIHGLWIEVNPIIYVIISQMGPGLGLASVKLVAAGLGILLHLRQVHGTIALLTTFYVGVALLPWCWVLFFW